MNCDYNILIRVILKQSNEYFLQNILGNVEKYLSRER